MATVGVTAECQVDRMRDARQQVRVVRHEQCRGADRPRGEAEVQVRAPVAVVVDACEEETAWHRAARIYEGGEPDASQVLEEASWPGEAPVLVVAEYEVHATNCPKIRQRLEQGTEIGRCATIDDISTEHDHIRARGQNRSDPVCDALTIGIRPEMEVGSEGDAKRMRETIQPQLDTLDS